MKKLIKSYNFWTALAGSVGLLVVSIGKMLGYEIQAQGVEEVIMAICGVLIVFGIVKKPTTKTTDNQQEEANNSNTVVESKSSNDKTK